MRFLFIVFINLQLILSCFAQDKTFSTSAKTSQYTQCFDGFADSLNNILSYRFSKLFYTLNDVKTAFYKEEEKFWSAKRIVTKPYEPEFDTSLNIQKRVLNETDKNDLSQLLSLISQKIYSITINKEFPDLKGNARLFKCNIKGVGLNLIAPKKEDWSLSFPEDVIRSIYVRSLIDIFIKLDSSKTFVDNLDPSDEAEIFSPLEYLYTVKKNQSYYPPCLPILRKSDALKLINNKSYRKTSLTTDDKEALDIVKEQISNKDYYGEILCSCQFSSSYSRTLLSGLVISKLPIDLQKVIKKANKNKTITEEFIEDNYKQWIVNEIKVGLISNYVSLEVLKYLVFTIAHECYHSWFAYNLPGKQHELNADAFATFIYLRFFTSQKDVNDFVKKMNFSFQQILSGQDDNEFSTDEMNELLEPYLGKPITEIFDQALKTNAFYEKQDNYHPPFSQRITSIRNLIGQAMNSDEAIALLKSKLLNIFSKQ